MILKRLLLHAAILFLDLPTISAEFYWISDECGKGVQEAVAEVVWVAGRIAESISLKESWLNENMRWWFGMNVESSSATFVAKTYKRMSQMKSTYSRLDAELRIYCDNDKRYVPVDSHKNTISPPSMGSNAWDLTVFYDRDNEVLKLGRTLGCSSSTKPYAYTQTFIERDFWTLNHRRGSTQLPDRHTITLCQNLMDRNNELRPWTWRDFAKRKVHKLTTFPNIKPLAAHVLMHEFAHVEFLSEQTLTMDTQNGPSNDRNGRDTHPEDLTGPDGKLALNGYYYGEETITLGEKLADTDFTIMNPDSYAYLASAYRLRDKKWKAYKNDKGLVLFEEDGKLTEKGDGPIAA